MRCSDIMKTKVECLRPEDTVREAARKMRDENIGFVPVCDQDGSPLGAVTDRDIAVRAVANDLESETSLADVMTNELVTVAAEDDVEHAKDLMSEHHKSRIMCLDEDGHLAGIISLSDLAQQGGADQVLSEVTRREARV